MAMWFRWLLTDIIPPGGGGGGEPGPPGPEGKEGKEGPAGKFTALVWKAVEAVNANLTNPATAEWSPIQCALGDDGMVRMTGAGKPSAEILAKGILFTLPPTCRPEHLRSFTLSVNSTTSTINILIKVNGEVEAVSAVKITFTVDFSQVQFPVKV